MRKAIGNYSQSFGEKSSKNASIVTGGAGFIGSHIAEHLVNMGHDVVVLDDLSGGFERNIPKDAKFIRGSVFIITRKNRAGK